MFLCLIKKKLIRFDYIKDLHDLLKFYLGNFSLLCVNS